MHATHENPIQRGLGILSFRGLLLTPSLSHFSSCPAIISTVPLATCLVLLSLFLSRQNRHAASLTDKAG